ncbi:MFS transporter [Thalassococcus sp. BH17M4-6]|uniref:MFS transporter n=1 Tax=Thalassococcus sp. BH17M4-6 TaxID=3413148 RepID=UPI003BE416B0
MGTENRFLITLLSACNFVIGMGAFVVIGLLSPVEQALGVTTAKAGYLMTVYAIAYAILSPLLVSWTGALGRRRVLAIGMGLFGLGALASALAPGIGWLYAARVVMAAGAGMFTPVSAAVAAGLSAPEERGRVLAAVVFGLTLAQVFGVPTGSWVAYTFGWRVAFWLVLALAVVALWLVWTRVPRGLRFQPVTLGDLGKVLRNGLVMGAVLFTASFLGSIYVLFTYFQPLLSDTMGFGRDGITLALLVFGLGAVAGNVLGGFMADRIGPVRTLVVLCLAQIVILPVFSALPMPQWLLFAVIFVWSVCGWSFMAGQQLRLLGLAPQSASVVLALNAAAIYVGSAAGSAVGAQVLHLTGPGLLGVAASIAMLATLGHILWSHRAATLSSRTSKAPG